MLLQPLKLKLYPAGQHVISYIGRVTYDFQGKYLLNAALRHDGGSYWAPGNKWQTFPSASVGWRIDQEDFMRDQTKISELKLRAGYGITGLNGAVLGATPWLATVSANSAYYPFGNSYNAGPASSIQRLGNKNLEWETTKQINIGVDLGLLNNAITLTAEYYQRKTDNLCTGIKETDHTFCSGACSIIGTRMFKNIFYSHDFVAIIFRMD